MKQKKATHKWVVIGDLIVCFTTEGPIPDEVWDLFVKDLKEKPIKRYLGACVGKLEVTSIQRKQAAEILSPKKISMSIITDEKLVRGMATALSWFGVDIKAFSWVEMRHAIRYLGISGPMEERVVTQVELFKKQG